MNSDLIKKRKRYLAPSFSLSYKKPLHIVRGKGQYLFDAEGNKYLDVINNIAHVGHCHPKVIEAAHRQNKKLNTNTRYLHNSILNYAENLCKTLPDGLEVCYFTNSGSESNDLALRIARTYTKSNESIVMFGGYHGHTATLIDVSAYKFFSSGGDGKKNHIHVIPVPDEFKGEHLIKGSTTFCEYYIEIVQRCINQIEKEGKRLGLFIVEPIMGCGGQIILPNVFLNEVFKLVKKAGGLCIVDEVQIGFGRVGSHFWGFQMSDIIPDIVTLGKSIGNGHPLSAVITRKDIAEKFNNGMEYFNSFGGNPVSSEVGQVVLNIIRDENLQKNALNIGSYLLSQLKEIKKKHKIIGHVRGRGLFLGIELIKNYENMTPASGEAESVVNLMKERKILISRDGPDNNVLKIKPPLVFNKKDAKLFLDNLDEVLTDNNFGVE